MTLTFSIIWWSFDIVTMVISENSKQIFHWHTYHWQKNKWKTSYSLKNIISEINQINDTLQAKTIFNIKTEIKYYTRYVIDRIEANSKSSNFQRVILLPASCYFLNTMPVLWGENGIVVYIESWPWMLNAHAHIRKKYAKVFSSFKKFLHIKLLIWWEDEKKWMVWLNYAL